jgi:hypothetical protein
LRRGRNRTILGTLGTNVTLTMGWTVARSESRLYLRRMRSLHTRSLNPRSNDSQASMAACARRALCRGDDVADCTAPYAHGTAQHKHTHKHTHTHTHEMVSVLYRCRLCICGPDARYLAPSSAVKLNDRAAGKRNGLFVGGDEKVSQTGKNPMF